MRLVYKATNLGTEGRSSLSYLFHLLYLGFQSHLVRGLQFKYISHSGYI